MGHVTAKAVGQFSRYGDVGFAMHEVAIGQVFSEYF
jgi:hypothetical protein